MTFRKDLYDKIAERFGPVIDVRNNPDVFHRLVDDIAILLQQSPGTRADAPSSPFGVSWMDSWVAHWVYAENLRGLERQNAELATALRGLLDVKFNERLAEIQRFLRDRGRVSAPDAGPPEPGTPPAGPARFAAEPEPPDGGPPEPGVPDPPAPPGPEPDAGFLRENPWILYWFLSIRTPLLLDVIDTHLTRRLNELKTSSL